MIITKRINGILVEVNTDTCEVKEVPEIKYPVVNKYSTREDIRYSNDMHDLACTAINLLKHNKVSEAMGLIEQFDLANIVNYMLITE